MRRVLALGLLGCACAGPQVAADRAAPAAAVGAEREVYVCRYKLNPYYLPEGELRVRGDLPPFATVESARAAGTELTLPWGPARQGLQAKFTSGWVTLRTHFLPRKGLQVVSHNPLAFGTVLAFEPGARLEWLDSTDDGKMLVEVRRPENYQPTMPLRARVRCEDTTIGVADRKKSEPEPADAGTPAVVELADRVDIPVSATPGGPPEGTLRFEKDDWRDEARVLGEERGQLKIRKGLWPAVVTGWVPRQHTRAIDEKDRVSNLFGAVGGLGLRGSSEGSGKPAWPRCAQGVDLFLAVGGQLYPVGEVHKGAAVLEKERLSGWVTVKLPELEWVQLLPAASWALKPGALERCLAGPPPPAPKP